MYLLFSIHLPVLLSVQLFLCLIIRSFSYLFNYFLFHLCVLLSSAQATVCNQDRYRPIVWSCVCLSFSRVSAFCLLMCQQIVFSCVCPLSAHVSAHRLLIGLLIVCSCACPSSSHVSAYCLLKCLPIVFSCVCLPSTHVPHYRLLTCLPITRTVRKASAEGRRGRQMVTQATRQSRVVEIIQGLVIVALVVLGPHSFAQVVECVLDSVEPVQQLVVRLLRRTTNAPGNRMSL